MDDDVGALSGAHHIGLVHGVALRPINGQQMRKIGPGLIRVAVQGPDLPAMGQQRLRHRIADTAGGADDESYLGHVRNFHFSGGVRLEAKLVIYL